MVKQLSKLQKALSFVALSGAKECHFCDGMLYSIHENVIMEHRVDEQLNLSVGIKSFQAALKGVGENHALIEAEGSLQIKSDSLRFDLATSPTIPIPEIQIDMMIPGHAEILLALQAVSLLPKKTEDPRTLQIYSTGDSFVASNRRAILEAWHGMGIPIGCLPAHALKALNKIKEVCTGIGWNNQYLVFKFEDSRLIIPCIFGEWIDYEPFFDLEPIHKADHEIKNALNEILPFCYNVVTFKNDEISFFDVVRFLEWEYIGECDYYAEEMRYFIYYGECFNYDNRKFLFYGDGIRGVISSVESEG